MNDISKKIQEKILNDIHSKLNPPFQKIILKMFAIHLSVALITMSLCPQLGLSTFKTNINLMNYFMYFGKTSCNILCGIFFLSTSMFVSFLVLSHDEDRIIRSKRWLSTLCLILFSIGFFIIFNPRLFIEFSFLWLLGAFIGALISIEIGSLAKKLISHI